MTTTTQLIAGIDFVGLPTRDLDTAVAFYGETLGLPRTAYRPHRHHAEFDAGGVTLNVHDVEKMGARHVPNANALALHVEDVAAARAALEERGVAFAGETVDTGVCHMAFFADPDGNELMLHRRYAPQSADR